jgi:hypothetical protein
MFTGKAYFYLTNRLAFGTFHSLHWKVNINRFPSYRYRSKAPYLQPSTAHFAASTNWTSKSPIIISYGYNYGTCNITRTLVKIPDYAKGVIQQTGRHVEKASSLKSDDNFKFFFTVSQHSFYLACTHLPDEPKDLIEFAKCGFQYRAYFLQTLKRMVI